MILKEPLLEEELRVLLSRREDPEAREKIILHNIRLVNFIAKRYYNPEKNELDDLFQQGVLGLIKAIKKYDPDKGTFSNYAAWWIKESIIRVFYDSGNIIRIPEHMVQKINSLIEVKSKLYQELGREPTKKEISSAMDLKLEEVIKIINVIKQPRSLEEPIDGEDGEITLRDSIKDDLGPTIEETVEEREIGRQLVKTMENTLTIEENKILLSRYGINGREYTLRELGKRFNKTHERIRQIERKALNKLRRTKFIIELKKELYIEELTPYYKGRDYTQPRVKETNKVYSSVEDIILWREKMREDYDKWIMEVIPEKKETEILLDEIEGIIE